MKRIICVSNNTKHQTTRSVSDCVVDVGEGEGNVKLGDVARARIVRECDCAVERGDNLVADGKSQARALFVA